MYLFGRRARLSGSNLREALGWATSITERVSQATGLQVRLASVVFSLEVGDPLVVGYRARPDGAGGGYRQTGGR